MTDVPEEYLDWVASSLGVQRDREAERAMAGLPDDVVNRIVTTSVSPAERRERLKAAYRARA